MPNSIQATPGQPSYVCSVATDSPAWYCGLRAGDQLWAINSKFVRGELLETVSDLVQTAQGQTMLVVSMLRDVHVSPAVDSGSVADLWVGEVLFCPHLSLDTYFTISTLIIQTHRHHPFPNKRRLLYAVG